MKSFLRSSNPHIAHTVNGFDVGMPVRFNFTADAADRCGKCVFIHIIFICIPQLFKQYLPGQDSLRISCQHF